MWVKWTVLRLEVHKDESKNVRWTTDFTLKKKKNYGLQCSQKYEILAFDEGSY